MDALLATTIHSVSHWSQNQCVDPPTVIGSHVLVLRCFFGREKALLFLFEVILQHQTCVTFADPSKIFGRNFAHGVSGQPRVERVRCEFILGLFFGNVMI